jgi:hypothetical protein
MVAMLLASVSLRIETTDGPRAPWASNHHPTDVSKREIHELNAGWAEYVIVQGGRMDGRNCRTPQGVWQPLNQAIHQLYAEDPNLAEIVQRRYYTGLSTVKTTTVVGKHIEVPLTVRASLARAAAG